MELYRIALFVSDQAKALEFFVNVFGFEVVQDEIVRCDKRVIRVQPQGSSTPFNLQIPIEEDLRILGKQARSTAFAIIQTDNIDEMVKRFEKNNVTIVKPLRSLDVGEVILVEDLEGNRWEFVERHQ
jgi:predicted enzyme related to lactoylglutathione lyase